MRNTKANVANAQAPRWNERDEQRAARLWSEGKTGSEIAEKLGRTRGQVLGKLGRLGLLGNRSEHNWGEVPDNEKARRFRVCAELARNGGCVADAADAVGIHRTTLAVFLRAESRDDLAEALIANASSSAWRKRRAA